MRNIVYLLCFSLLAACAPTRVSKPEIPETTVAPEHQLSYPKLRAEFAKILGAQVSESDPFVASFPAGTLFTADSVIPMPGGTGMLDALTALMKDFDLIWTMTLHAATGEGLAHDQDLAAERVRVMQTYLKSSGVSLRYIQFIASPTEGAPLEISVIRPVVRATKGGTP